MLHVRNEEIQKRLFNGLTGLEKEGLRVTGEGFFAQTAHPFPADDPYIVRDFSENQTEINTRPAETVEKAYGELLSQTRRIKEVLSSLPECEYLWPFSNPPYIVNEENIPIARFTGKDYKKTEYRKYLSDRYGRYKMTFSGIHFNYSFGEDLLHADHELSEVEDYREYKDRFYISLAAAVQMYNWLIVAITAASPLLDSSYFEKGTCGNDVFNGMASSRCSEIGYWNFFTPLLDYTDLESYAASIDKIVESGLIQSPSELYFPVRIKPAGAYSRHGLKETGADHIELRMIDLNPLDEAGIDLRDIRFLQLFLVYLACGNDAELDASAQIASIANTKNAARFDLKTVHLVSEHEGAESIAEAAIRIIDSMRSFYARLAGTKTDGETEEVLLFERAKFTEIKNRYAWKVRENFSGGFVKKGMQMLKGEGRDTEEILRACLYDKYIAPIRHNKNDYIGIEIEMPILNLDREAVDFANVHKVTEKFMHEFVFRPEKRDENKDVCLAEHEVFHDSLSFDCSYNNLEISMGKVEDLSEADERFRRYYGFLKECFTEYNYTLTGMGINPYRKYNQNVPVPNGRYRMLFHHLHSYEKYRKLPMYFHLHPEFGTFSSASQVQLDVNEKEFPEVINTFSLLEPVKALIFSNSVLLGEEEDYLCYRDILWENSTHGVNPHNVGPYEYIFRDTDDFLDYVLSTSMYCAERDGKYVNFRPVPLREYFSLDEIEGEYYSEGKYHKMILKPRMDDLEYLRTFKHEDLTYRGTVEFRSVCCQPIRDAMSVAAFHTGLKKRLPELTQLLNSDRTIYGRGYNAAELRHLFIKRELPSFVNVDEVYELAGNVLQIAEDGLKDRGLSEERFLKPLFERVERRENPAMHMLNRLSQGAEIEELIKEYG